MGRSCCAGRRCWTQRWEWSGRVVKDTGGDKGCGSEIGGSVGLSVGIKGEVVFGG